MTNKKIQEELKSLSQVCASHSIEAQEGLEKVEKYIKELETKIK